jgi:hypothetical protein
VRLSLKDREHRRIVEGRLRGLHVDADRLEEKEDLFRPHPHLRGQLFDPDFRHLT